MSVFSNSQSPKDSHPEHPICAHKQDCSGVSLRPLPCRHFQVQSEEVHRDGRGSGAPGLLPLETSSKGLTPWKFVCLIYGASLALSRKISLSPKMNLLYSDFFFLFKDAPLSNSSELGIIWICHMVLIYRRFCLAVNTDKRSWGFSSRMNILYLMKARF